MNTTHGPSAATPVRIVGRRPAYYILGLISTPAGPFRTREGAEAVRDKVLAAKAERERRERRRR